MTPIPQRSRQGGFTLLELLIAITLMAVIAVLGWRGLDSLLAGRERLNEANQQLRALTTVMTQLEDDLRRAWPNRLLGLDRAPISFVLEGEQLRLEIVREAGTGALTPMQRVVWQVRSGALERGFSGWPPAAVAGGPAMIPGPGEEASPLTWQRLIEAPVLMEWRAWRAGAGWVPASALLTEPGVMPLGLELTLSLGQSRIVRVMAARD